MAGESVAQRMFDARQQLETSERQRITLDELGRRIAEQEGRADEPYAAPVVRRWLEGEAEPRSMATWRAIAKVFGVRVGWLANGELPMRDTDEGNADAGKSDPPARPPLRFEQVSDTVDLPDRRPAAKRQRRKGNGG